MNLGSQSTVTCKKKSSLSKINYLYPTVGGNVKCCEALAVGQQE